MFNLFRQGRVLPQNIEAIIFDFDGVFTDNKVNVTEDGKESVTCNRADGLGIKMLREKKIPLFILSSETNQVVARRAQKLALELWYGAANKKEALITFCAAKGLNVKNIIYVGNDINDYEAMKIVGYPAAPKDAHPKIRSIAKYILNKRGGEGVVKELAESLIK